MTPERNTDPFLINAGVLHGDSLGPFLFIICLDYVLRNTMSPTDCLTLKYPRISIHPEDVLLELANADKIVFMENTLQEAEKLLHRVERET